MYQHGLKTLTEKGAWFKNAAYPYLNTVTCAGHSTLGTGTLPYKHGMVLNAWFDRDSGKTMTCTQDGSVTEVSATDIPGIADSAKNVKQPSLAELLHKDKGRVVTMSIKPRSAIGLAGHHADSVTWYDERGNWETSTAYSSSLPLWLTAFVKGNPVERDAGKIWERTLPADRYRYADDAPGEASVAGWTNVFPHPLGAAGDRGYYAHWLTSPYANDYLEQMAEAAVDSFKLGNGKATDFLGISFSALDTAGHAYGPRSHEVQDVLVRLDADDRQAARLSRREGRRRQLRAGLELRSRCRDDPGAGRERRPPGQQARGGRHRDGVEIDARRRRLRRDDRLHGHLPAKRRLRSDQEGRESDDRGQECADRVARDRHAS